MSATIAELEKAVDSAISQGLDLDNLARIEELAADIDDSGIKINGVNLGRHVTNAALKAVQTGEATAVYTFETSGLGFAAYELKDGSIEKAVWDRVSIEDSVTASIQPRRIWTSEPDYPYETTDQYGNFRNDYIQVATIMVEPKVSEKRPE
jgi:hypothetical protein